MELRNLYYTAYIYSKITIMRGGVEIAPAIPAQRRYSIGVALQHPTRNVHVEAQVPQAHLTVRGG
jgi:hypothetical protein